MAKTIQTETRSQRLGWTFLTAWAVLIISGIIAKRVFGHPDLMVFFHLPAAVFLVMAWHRLSRRFRERNNLTINAWRQTGRPIPAPLWAKPASKTPKKPSIY